MNKDGDTPLHNVLLLHARSTLLPEVLIAMFEVRPRNIENASKINQVRQSHLRQSSSIDRSIGRTSVIFYLHCAEEFCWAQRLLLLCERSQRTTKR